MSLEDIKCAAKNLGRAVERQVNVIEGEDEWVAVVVRDEPTPADKKWQETVDLVMRVHQDFPKTGPEPSGFHVSPRQFWNGGVEPRNRGDSDVPGVGPCSRLSWKPEGYEQADLVAYYRWMRARIWFPGG